MVKHMLLLGAPGVGKGTLASEYAKRHGLMHISTGEIFRREITNGTALGKKVQAIMAAGDYVADELTNEIVRKALTTPEVQKHGFILDGYPRTANQAFFLQNNGFAIDVAILLEAPLPLVIKRLMGRGRADDTAETISQRIAVYDEQTKPLITFYRDLHKLDRVDVSGTVEQNMQILEKVIARW